MNVLGDERLGDECRTIDLAHCAPPLFVHTLIYFLTNVLLDSMPDAITRNTVSVLRFIEK